MVVNNISTRFYGSFDQQSSLSAQAAALASAAADERAGRTPFSLFLQQSFENPEDSARQLALLRIQSQAGPTIAAEVVRDDGSVNRIRMQQLLAQQQELNRELQPQQFNAPVALNFEA